MRLSIDHRTTYRFSEPQARVVQMLRMTPEDTRAQSVISWRIDVGCDVRLHEMHDGLGNTVTMLYADGPIAELDIAVSGQVLTLTGDGDGAVAGAAEPLPPMFFLRNTPRTTADAALARFAADATAAAHEPLEALHLLSNALHARFGAAPGTPDRGATAAEAFARAAADPRDFAQMFAAAARSLGIPARCISGYRSSGATSCAPHAWVEGHVEGLGWVAFDPSTGTYADECHVRVAVGLDATGTAPVVGSRIGSGEEVLAVDLHVDSLGAGE